MKFIEVQCVNTFFCTKYQVLICKHKQTNKKNPDLRKLCFVTVCSSLPKTRLKTITCIEPNPPITVVAFESVGN